MADHHPACPARHDPNKQCICAGLGRPPKKPTSPKSPNTPKRPGRPKR